MNKELSDDEIAPKRTKEISIELSNDSFWLLNHATSRLCYSESELFEKMIFLFLDMPGKVKEDLQKYMMVKSQIICEELACCDDLYRREYLFSLKKRYDDMSYTIGYELCTDFFNELEMTSIQMNKCTLTYPANWIILNKDAAANSTHAIVVETQNGRYYNAPIFLFLCNREGTNQINDPIYNTINKLIEERWPKFKELKYLDFDEVFDPVTNDMINFEERLHCPHAGYFNLAHGADASSVPYGAIITDDVQ